MHDSKKKLVRVAATIRPISPSQKIVLDWVAPRQIFISTYSALEAWYTIRVNNITSSPKHNS